jgi:tripartite-type tricarboxylate transporter receptor subunit TctC
VPPVSDTLPGFELLGWYGLQAPAGTPAHIVRKIHADLAKVLRAPEMAEKLHAVGADPVGTSPSEFAAFLRKETDRWDRVLRESGGVIAGSKPKP